MKKLVWKGEMGPDVLCAVSVHCNNVRHLELSAVESEDLEALNIWETIVNPVEILKLTINSPGEEEMRKILKYFRKLKDIEIYCIGPIETLNASAFSKCLISYEGQLERTVIRDMALSDLQHVLKGYPNVKISLECQRPDFVSCFKMMGKQLDKVAFGMWPDYDDVRSDQAGAWDACPNVREIVIDRDLQLCAFQAIRRWCGYVA